MLPIGFHLVGSTPIAWVDDINNGAGHLDAIKEEIGHIAGYIQHNERALKRNARNFKTGALFGVLAPVAGAGFAIALKLFFLACAAGWFA